MKLTKNKLLSIILMLLLIFSSTVAVFAGEDADKGLKLQATIPDGTYTPEATFSGGSGRVTFSCNKVVVSSGTAYATIEVNSDTVTHLYMGVAPQSAEDKSLYDPDTGKCGANVYAFSGRKVTVPVTVNTSNVHFSGRTSAMSEEHRWINSYTYTIKIDYVEPVDPTPTPTPDPTPTPTPDPTPTPTPDPTPTPTPSGDTTVDSVRTAIQDLSAVPTSYKITDKAAVEKIWADYQKLSASEQAALDKEETHPTTGQPLGRVLEAALWSVWSYDTIDNSTKLPDGTYDAATIPAISSAYSKGKSTSEKDRPWSVKSVTVANGKATAVIAVESDTYIGIWIGGVTYPQTNRTGNSEFANVPIDLNSTFYFAGISSVMPLPIAFSMTTTIDENAEVKPEPDPKPAEKEETKITVTSGSNKKTIKIGGKKLNKNKTFTVKTKASSGAKTTYKKVGGNKKITINKSGKVTVKKGLKKGSYSISVKIAAGETDTAKAATKTIKVTVKLK